MSRDKSLEEILNHDLSSQPGVTEKAMFGGWAWFLNGNLLCGARDDGMLVRLGKDNDHWALQMPGAVPMVSRGRRMHGWVRVAPAVYGDDALRRKLIDSALSFVQSLQKK